MDNQNENNIEDNYLRRLEEDQLRRNHQYDYFSKNLEHYEWKRDLYMISNSLINIAYSLCSVTEQNEYNHYLTTLKHLSASITIMHEKIISYRGYEKYLEFSLKSQQFIQVCKEAPSHNNQVKLYEFFERLLDTFEELPIPDSFRSH